MQTLKDAMQWRTFGAGLIGGGSTRSDAGGGARRLLRTGIVRMTFRVLDMEIGMDTR